MQVRYQAALRPDEPEIIAEQFAITAIQNIVQLISAWWFDHSLRINPD